MKSIRWKLVIMYIALVFIVMVISGVVIVFTMRDSARNSAESNLKRLALNIRGSVIEPGFPVDTDTSEIDPTGEMFSLSDFPVDEYTEAAIIKDAPYKLTTIASTITDEIKDYPDYSSPVIISAANNAEKFRYAVITDNNTGETEPVYEYAAPYTTLDGGVRLIIYARSSAAADNAKLTQITDIYAISSLAALVLASALGVAFASYLTGPIKNLSHKANELAAGNLGQHIEVVTKDEIGQLNESFNYMASELTQKMNDIGDEKSKLEIVLNNMSDGALAYDDKGSLIHANYICGELLGASDFEKADLNEMLQILGLGIKEDGLTDAGEQTIALNGRYINALFNIYEKNDGTRGGVVIVLQDVTKRMKIVNMQKEFVANVSHELRTPLTTIKGYVETLIEDDTIGDADKCDFLRTIDDETDRMAGLVNDLLDLSKLDDNQMEFSFIETNLTDMIRTAVKQNALAAEKLNKTLEFETPSFDTPVVADPGRINQVLNNIITNSFKYSGDGAHVKIEVEESESYFRVYIRDNGIGIPKEDQRRIFERFYRVDKARSRELGGTGLGLSIAKEIMEAHNGKISCFSELGKGTTMILKLPKDIYSASAETDSFGL